jgi:hypothetical protein
MNNNHSTPLFYRPKVRKALWNLLLFFCGFPIIYELISEKRYSYFAKDGFQSIDAMFSFYGLVGLCGSLVFIILATALSFFIRVGEAYYNDDF